MRVELSQFLFCFDVEQLQKEAIRFSEADWIVHEHTDAGDASLPLVSILFFVIGVVWARLSKPFAYAIRSLVEGFIESYGYIAPIVNFLILTPTLIKLYSLREASVSSQ